MNLLDDAHKWLDDLQVVHVTHNETCHTHHAGCLVTKLVDELERLHKIIEDYVKVAQSSAQEIERLKRR